MAEHLPHLRPLREKLPGGCRPLHPFDTCRDTASGRRGEYRKSTCAITAASGAAGPVIKDWSLQQKRSASVYRRRANVKPVNHKQTARGALQCKERLVNNASARYRGTSPQNVRRTYLANL